MVVFLKFYDQKNVTITRLSGFSIPRYYGNRIKINDGKTDCSWKMIR